MKKRSPINRQAPLPDDFPHIGDKMKLAKRPYQFFGAASWGISHDKEYVVKKIDSVYAHITVENDFGTDIVFHYSHFYPTGGTSCNLGDR